MDSEIWIPNYNLFRCDREIRSSGGVGLYIKEELACTELLNSTNEVVEVLGIKVENINLIIVLIYKPPDATVEEFTEQILKIETILDNLANPVPDIIFLGDFNLPSLKWRMVNNNIIAGNPPGSNQPQVRELLRFCDKFSLSQQITEPTRNENTLDLIFTNNDELIRDITISDTTYSDHKLIEVQTNINNGSRPKRNIKREGLFSKFNFNNKRIDWEKINRDLTNIQWETVLSNKNPTQGIEKLTSEAYEVCLKYVPLRKARKRSNLERERRRHYKRRKKITGMLKQTRLSIQRRNNLNREIEEIEQRLKHSYQSEERDLEQKAIQEIKKNPKYFFTYAKSKAKTTASIGPIRTSEGSYTEDDKEISEILNKQYEDMFSTPINSMIAVSYTHLTLPTKRIV